MLIRDLANAGSAPALEATLRFAGERQRLLAHAIANLDTPNYRAMDLSVRGFRAALAQAVRERRDAGQGEGGALRLPETREITRGADGTLRFHAGTPSGNILYHDRNNRDPERLMQALAENQLAFRVASDLLRRHNDILRVAIGQRV